MPLPRKHPALFHRIFLSHLLTVLLCFVAALILVDYLFADNVHLYLIRNPIVLIPALLALIGIAGLFAVWTAGSATLPLAKLTRFIEERADADEIRSMRDHVGIEENADLVDALTGMLQRMKAADLRPLVLVLDTYLNIRSADPDTAARLGTTPEEIGRCNLRSFLPRPDDLRTICSLCEPVRTEDSAADVFTLHFSAAADRTLITRCRILPLQGEEERFLLFAWEARRAGENSREASG
ncbi:MAG: hypothetical protein JXA28_14760 [Bacteroidetes bacterium]|nr:hypothetical protein [Bacteroidota bacterium]